jgi:hypothetical protein
MGRVTVVGPERDNFVYEREIWEQSHMSGLQANGAGIRSNKRQQKEN